MGRSDNHQTTGYDQFNYLEAIKFLWSQKQWFQKMWWVFCLCLIPFVGYIIIRGWRLNLVRRISRSEEQSLPYSRDILNFLTDGVILVIMTGIYYIPAIIAVTIIGISEYRLIIDIFWWVIDTIFIGKQTASFWIMFGKGITGFIISLSAPAIYVFIMGPIYRAAMLRFAVTGKVSSFFNIFNNISMLGVNFISFIHVSLLQILTSILLIICSIPIISILSSTGIGAILVPIALSVVVAFNYCITGYLFGSLAIVSGLNRTIGHNPDKSI